MPKSASSTNSEYSSKTLVLGICAAAGIVAVAWNVLASFHVDGNVYVMPSTGVCPVSAVHSVTSCVSASRMIARISKGSSRHDAPASVTLVAPLVALASVLHGVRSSTDDV